MKLSNSCDVFTNRAQNFAINSSPITKMIRKHLTIRLRVVWVKTICRKIDFVGNRNAESTRYFFLIILNFISKLFIKIKIFEKRFLVLKSFLPISRELLVRKINFRFAILRKRLLDELIRGHSRSKTDKFQNLANKNYLVFAETTHQHK